MKTNSDQPAMPAEAEDSETGCAKAVVCKEWFCVSILNKIALTIMAVTAFWITGRGEWINQHESDALSDFDVISFALQFLCWCYLGCRMIRLLFGETFKTQNDQALRPAK